MSEEAKCCNCKTNPAEELHSCPFACEILGDTDEEYCDCCVDCEMKCYEDI